MTSHGPAPADLRLVVAALRKAVPDDDLEWPGGYPDQVELALIDAVLSIQARYGQPFNGVRGQVELWRQHRDGQANDLSSLARGDLGQVLTNRQRISGMLKVEAIAQAAQALQDRGLTSAADVIAHPDDARQGYCSVHGLSTVTFDYFQMLLGTETIKPDTWILRFLHQALGRTVTRGEATMLMTAAAHQMGRSTRQLDHQVWQHMRTTPTWAPLPSQAPAEPPLSDLSLSQLLQRRGQIDAELRERHVIRTGTSLAGELLEFLVAEAYGGQLSTPGAKSVDVTLLDGRTVQVKARWLDQGTSRVFGFSDFDFDVAVMALLDRSTYALVWAREVTVDELRSIARPYKGRWRVSMSEASRAGFDIAELLAGTFLRF